MKTIHLKESEIGLIVLTYQISDSKPFSQVFLLDFDAETSPSGEILCLHPRLRPLTGAQEKRREKLR